MRQKPWQIVFEILFYAVGAGFVFFVWDYFGTQTLQDYWTWQWRPYVELWDKYVDDFFTYEGRGYAQLVYLLLGAFFLITAFRISIFAAKLVVAVWIATLALSGQNIFGVPDLSVQLTVLTLAACLWIVAAWFIEDVSWRDLLFGGLFGDSRWATRRNLRKVGLFKKGGLFLGRSRGRDLYHSGEEHIFTLGGTGGGKSSGLVVPALLTLTQGSVVVTDPSGELAAMTRTQRAKNGPVVLLSPYEDIFAKGGLDFPDTGFNPLSVIDATARTFKSDCDVIAQYLMVTDRRESGSYFNDEGKAFLSLMIAKTLLYDAPELRNLSFIYSVVRDSPKALAETLKAIIAKGHPTLRYEAEGFLGIIESAPEQWQGIIRKAANATERYAPGTPLGEHVKKEGFNAADLKGGNVTVYLLVPSGQLRTALPWMNMLIGVFGLEIGRVETGSPVTLLIDEAPSLGYLPDLIPFMAQYRKAGLRVWLFTQTMAQLANENLYGRSGFEAILGLSGIKQFFAVSEPEMQKHISELCGQKTADKRTTTGNRESLGDVGVPLIRPEKVRGLKKWRQIIIIDAMANPIRARLVPYFKRRLWAGMADKNPYRKA